MRRLLIQILLIVLLVSAGWSGASWAQSPTKTLQKVQTTVAPPASAPAPAGAPAGPAASSSAGAPGGAAQEPDDDYLMGGDVLYRHQNERDPFSPLVRTGAGAAGTSDVKVKRGTTGIARFTVEECNLEAILRVGGTVAAWFQGPDNKAYKCLAGERFADGVVLDINFDTGEVTVQQELTDTTAVKPFRNLVLKIRSQVGEGL